jgi:hypothetical protein
MVRTLVTLILRRVLTLLVRRDEHAKDLEIVVLRLSRVGSEYSAGPYPVCGAG